MSKKILGALALTLASAMMASSAMACTIYGIGKNATADGSTIVTHTCDSTGDDSRLWIIPEMEGGEGITRDIVMNGNLYGDWSDYPNTKDYGGGMVFGEMPQPENTHQYLHGNYSIINDHGVAMGESTCWFTPQDEHTQKLDELFNQNNNGIIDCYQVQHIALERAETAREAVQIIAQQVEEYGWNTSAECIEHLRRQRGLDHGGLRSGSVVRCAHSGRRVLRRCEPLPHQRNRLQRSRELHVG